MATSDVEQTRLDELEAVIQRELERSTLVIGAALAEIKRGQLYKEHNYRTWQDYLQERWGYDRSYAHRLIQAAKNTKALDTNLHALGLLPAAETVAGTIIRSAGQVRELEGRVPGVIKRVQRGTSIAKAVQAEIAQAVEDKEQQREARRTITERMAPPDHADDGQVRHLGLDATKPCPTCGGSGYVQEEDA